MADPYDPFNPTENPYEASPTRSGPDSGGEPCPPGQRKRPTMDGWECVDAGGSGGGDDPNTGLNVYGCPGDQVKIDLDASGKKGPEVCVSQAEASRRNQLWIGANPGSPGEGGGGGTTTSGGGGTYKPPTYTPTKSPWDAAMSEQLFKTLSDMIAGGNAPFGPDTIARLQAAALSSNKSQLANSEKALQRKLVTSGLSRSGVAPSSFQQLRSSSDADLSGNLRTVAVTAVQKNFEAKQFALQQAQAFLQSERANALSQDQIILGYARLAAESKNLQAQFDQQWKLAQSGQQWELERLLICLRTGVC